MPKKEFASYEIFQYNKVRKLTFAFSLIATVTLIILFAGIYFSLWRESEFFLLNWIRAALSHILINMDFPTFQASTTLGIFYTSAIGGLFFILTSMEGMFIALLKAGHPIILTNALYLTGIVVSYSINYFIGIKFSTLAQKIIGPRKFFKLKGIINKYGPIAIFVINVTPLLNQPLAAILGAVKYTKSKFYIYTMLGQIIKFAVITIALTYFL